MKYLNKEEQTRRKKKKLKPIRFDLEIIFLFYFLFFLFFFFFFVHGYTNEWMRVHWFSKLFTRRSRSSKKLKRVFPISALLSFVRPRKAFFSSSFYFPIFFFIGKLSTKKERKRETKIGRRKSCVPFFFPSFLFPSHFPSPSSSFSSSSTFA